MTVCRNVVPDFGAPIWKNTRRAIGPPTLTSRCTAPSHPSGGALLRCPGPRLTRSERGENEPGPQRDVRMSGLAALSPGSAAGAIEVDEEAFRFLSPDVAALDVLFDGRRIWSIAPAEHPTDDDGYRRVAWPKPI